MGYYSDIYIKAKEKAYKEIRKALEDGEISTAEYYKDNSGNYYVICNWLKWYSEYKTVDTVEKLIEECNEKEEDGYICKLIVIGEDCAIRELGDEDDCLDFYVNVSVSMPKKEITEID